MNEPSQKVRIAARDALVHKGCPPSYGDRVVDAVYPLICAEKDEQIAYLNKIIDEKIDPVGDLVMENERLLENVIAYIKTLNDLYGWNDWIAARLRERFT